MAAHLGGQIASCGGLAAAAFGQTIMLIDTRYVHSPCLAVSSYVASLPSAVDAAASASLFSLGFSHVAFLFPRPALTLLKTFKYWSCGCTKAGGSSFCRRSAGIFIRRYTIGSVLCRQRYLGLGYYCCRSWRRWRCWRGCCKAALEGVRELPHGPRAVRCECFLKKK